MKLKGSSIYYALFLCVIIGLFLGGMILFAGINKQFESRLFVQERIMLNAASGVEYGIANFEELGEVPLEIDLYGNGIDSVSVKRKKWGAFDVVSSTAHHGNLSYSKMVLTGELKSADEPSLYLTDRGQPLSICGNTKIEGKSLLPKRGVKRAYVDGRNFDGDQLIKGRRGLSKIALPEMNASFTSEVLEGVQGDVKIWDHPDSIKNSFQEDAICFVHDGVVTLIKNKLHGQVYLEARDSIFVGKEANLDQIILKSRVIYIQSGFKGNLQAFASERIVLEDNVQLAYPSVLGIIEEYAPANQNAKLIIGEDSQVVGSVFAISNDPDFRKPVEIIVKEKARIDGMLFTQGRTQLMGTVNGSLYTNKFYLKTMSSEYENYIMDGTVTNDLPDDFVYIPIMATDQPLTKIQWLQ